MTDPAGLHWTSVATTAAAFTLAVWALRDTDAKKPPPTAGDPSAMRFRIWSRSGPKRTVDVADEARLGRGTDCDVVLDDPAVSKRHARVRFDGQAWIEDLDSTNGTFVNGRRVTGTTLLRRGDRIALGTAKIVFLGLVHRGPKGSKG